MRTLGWLVGRDLREAWAEGALLPVAFLVLVATLFPFALGPEPRLLAQIGGGVIWVAVLLAALLPIDRLVAPDLERGVIDQLRVRDIAPELIVTAKLLAHWLAFAPLMIGATLPACALLGVEGTAYLNLLISLLIGTPALAALGVLTACFTLRLERSGALASLLMLPLAVPVLIFGAAVLSDAPGASALLGGITLLLCALTPIAGGAALRGIDD